MFSNGLYLSSCLWILSWVPSLTSLHDELLCDKINSILPELLSATAFTLAVENKPEELWFILRLLIISPHGPLFWAWHSRQLLRSSCTRAGSSNSELYYCSEHLWLLWQDRVGWNRGVRPHNSNPKFKLRLSGLYEAVLVNKDRSMPLLCSCY